MLDIVYYHLPGAEQYCTVRGKGQSFGSLPDLDKSQGFLIAPFLSNADTPYVLISPSQVSLHHLPKKSRRLGVEWHEQGNKALYSEGFGELHTLLDKGLLNKVVLCRRVDGKVEEWNGSPEQLFRRACYLYPFQMTVLVNSEAAGIWLMATPEVLLRSNGNYWETMALAGTVTDNNGWGDKEIREQQIVEQYIAGIIAPFAEDIRKSDPFTTLAGGLQHRRTDFSFRMRDGSSVNDLVKSLHPTPAVCGLPKDLAIGSILRYEGIDRRYYSGFCGPWNINGYRGLFVSLRCMEIDGDRNFHLYAGGGLLKESNMKKEWMETENKMETMRNVLR